MVNRLIMDDGQHMDVLTTSDIVPCNDPLHYVVRDCIQAILDRNPERHFSLTLVSGKNIDVDDSDGCILMNQLLGNSLEDLKHVLCNYTEENRRVDADKELVA